MSINLMSSSVKPAVEKVKCICGSNAVLMRLIKLDFLSAFFLVGADADEGGLDGLETDVVSLLD